MNKTITDVVLICGPAGKCHWYLELFAPNAVDFSSLALDLSVPFKRSNAFNLQSSRSFREWEQL